MDYQEIIEKYEAYKQEMESLLDLMEDLTDDLPYQGDTCEFSQKICLLNAISEFRQNINGLQVEFFEDEILGLQESENSDRID